MWDLTYEDNLEFSSKMHTCEAYRDLTKTCTHENEDVTSHCNIINCIKRGKFESSRMKIESKGW